jgi:hypothetical protein
MLYLHEVGKLNGLFAAVKNRNEITDDPDAVFQTDADLFEQTFHNNIDTIDGKFDQWMEKKYSIKLHHYKQVQGESMNVNQMAQSSPIKEADLNAPNMNQQSSAGYNANEILNSLSIHVKKDFNDKMGDDAIAYLYYAEGDNKILDNIEEINYQRNDISFAEYKNKSFKKSVNRTNNFSFKGYQWGLIETVFVYVVMKDKSKSGIILKTIVYDN